MSFLVVAPLALAKDQEGAVHYHYEGAVISWLDDETAEHLIGNGIVEEIDDPAPVVVDDEGPADPAGDDGGDEIKRPAKTAPKPAWVDYVVSKGVDRAEAEKLEKAELIALAEG
jgi:hypothetical protein